MNMLLFIYLLLPLLMLQMALKSINTKALISKWESTLALDSRLLKLVPLVQRVNFHNESIGTELNVHDTELLKDLNNNSTMARSILKQVHDEDLEKLIRLRERSLQLSLKNLNSISFSLLSQTFASKNLQVKRIQWSGPESILVQFIGKNENVRPVKRLEELEMRMGDKQSRCYGLFHEKLNVPVAFVFIRLFKGFAETLTDLLSSEIKDEEVDSCMFYSINSPIRGLNGIEFGANLIKGVTKEIQQEKQQIRLFSTFSPIPQFRQWLRTRNQTAHLSELSPGQLQLHKSELLEACAEYLAKGATRDPVAKFHYRNGALLGRINFEADMSEIGFKQSYGLQVNYIYHQ